MRVREVGVLLQMPRSIGEGGRAARLTDGRVWSRVMRDVRSGEW